MTALFITLQMLVRDVESRVDRTRLSARDERGSVTLEQVLITVGLFVLATAAIAAITVVVNRYIARIR